ncbi:MAG: DUF4149 domain-containing protein [Aquificaceae bacterium]
MDKLLLFLNSAYLGLGSFFSFFVAPTLFQTLTREQAGAVVGKVFPVYFSLGLMIALATSLLSFKISKGVFSVALFNLLLQGIHLFYLQPKAHALKAIEYTAFMKLHGISMGMNLLSLLLTLVICILLIRR